MEQNDLLNSQIEFILVPEVEKQLTGWRGAPNLDQPIQISPSDLCQSMTQNDKLGQFDSL